MKKYYLLIFILHSLSIAYAQFKGGQQDGYFAILLQSSNNCSMFAGGNGIGYDTANIFGGCIMYKGDTATGYYAAEVSNSTNCIMYKGDTATGYYAAEVSSTTNCIMYKGAIGQGYKSDSLIQHLPCVLLATESSPLRARYESSYQGLLFWETYKENNVKRFEIQKSLDGIEWHTIGSVNGHGTTTTAQYYTFVDESATNETQYYRYKQIDVNDGFVYSNVVELSNTNEVPSAAFSVYPNPATDAFTIQYWGVQGITTTATLYDMLGREVLRKELPTLYQGNSEKISCENISGGAYILSIQVQNATYLRTNTRIIIAK